MSEAPDTTTDSPAELEWELRAWDMVSDETMTLAWEEDE